MSIDLDILYFLNRTIAAPWMDSIMIYLTNIQHWVPVYILAFAAMIWKMKWRGAAMVASCLIVVGFADLFTNKAIKELVARPRPCAMISDPSGDYAWIRTPDNARGGFSFPSSHAVNNFAGVVFFLFLFPTKPRIRWLLVPALIVALTRPYLGLHYPSDVLGGMVIGSLIGVAGGALYTRAETFFLRINNNRNKRS